MKSLEIVNELINEECFKEEKVVYSFERVIDEDYLQQIKADLEVLEIIRKKKVQLYSLELCMEVYETDREILFNYNNFFCLNMSFKLTMEELLKLKQWLEENENESI